MIYPLILRRRSTVLFDNTRKIPSVHLRQLFEAARWAPSSNNQQPWSFVFAERDDPYFKTLLACLDESNQVWASNASVLMLNCAQVISDYKGRLNRYARHDTGMAFANLYLQAMDLGLDLHPMGGFDPGKTRMTAAIPEEYEPVIFVAIGYRSESQNFPTHLLDREKKERKRRSLEKFVFKGKFGGKYPFLGMTGDENY